MMVPLGEWILRNACFTAASWSEMPDVRVAVNVSPAQFRSETIRQVVRDNVGLLAIADSIVIDPPDGGGPEDVVTVSVSFKHRFFLPGLDDIVPVDFTVRTAMRNEPFIR